MLYDLWGESFAYLIYSLSSCFIYLCLKHAPKLPMIHISIGYQLALGNQFDVGLTTSVLFLDVLGTCGVEC